MGLRAETTWNQRMFESDGHGYWLDPVNNNGVVTRANVRLIRLGETKVPSTRPMAAPMRAPTTVITDTPTAAPAVHGMDPSSQSPIGNMTAAAIAPRMAETTTFSRATAPMG